MGQGQKAALQARSIETRDKLIRALETLLRDQPYEEISVADIASEAGLSVGAVYRRFENKDAFIPVVLDLYKERLEAFNSEPDNQFTPTPETDLLSALIALTELSWRFMEMEGHLIRAAFIHARTRPDLISSDWDEFLENAAQSYRQFLDLYADQITVPDMDQAARMTLYLMNVGMAEYGLYPTQGPAAAIEMSSEQFTHALARAIYGYLTLPVE